MKSESASFDASRVSKLSADNWLKIVAIGSMFLAQSLPQGFVTQLLPAIYRSQGLDLKRFWIFSLAMIPSWMRWAWAPLVDRYGNARLGRRRSWIIPCTLVGTASYALLMLINPTPALIYLAAAIIALQVLVMTTQEMAVEGYMVEALYPAERAPSAGVRVVMEGMAELLALAGLGWVFATYGWRWAMAAAALSLLLFGLPLMIRREVPVNGVSRNAKPSIWGFMRRRGALVISLNLFLAGMGLGSYLPMIGAFLVDHGFEMGSVGSVMGIVVVVGMILGALVGIYAIRRRGVDLAVLVVAVGIFPGALVIAAVSGVSHLGVLQAIGAFLPGTTAICCYNVAIQTARISWAAGDQAVTDFAVGSCIVKSGLSAGIGVAGALASFVGWTLFFPIHAVFIVLSCLLLAVTMPRTTLP